MYDLAVEVLTEKGRTRSFDGGVVQVSEDRISGAVSGGGAAPETEAWTRRVSYLTLVLSTGSVSSSPSSSWIRSDCVMKSWYLRHSSLFVCCIYKNI